MLSTTWRFFSGKNTNKSERWKKEKKKYLWTQKERRAKSSKIPYTLIQTIIARLVTYILVPSTTQFIFIFTASRLVFLCFSLLIRTCFHKNIFAVERKKEKIFRWISLLGGRNSEWIIDFVLFQTTLLVVLLCTECFVSLRVNKASGVCYGGLTVNWK